MTDNKNVTKSFGKNNPTTNKTTTTCTAKLRVNSNSGTHGFPNNNNITLTQINNENRGKDKYQKISSKIIINK